MGRSTHQTRWLVALGQIDRQNPPIAGYNGISAPAGLTSLTLYDDNLSDGIGLDNSSGVTVTLPSGASQTVSLTTMLSKLADTNANGGAVISFNSSSAGSAMVQIRPTGELSAGIISNEE